MGYCFAPEGSWCIPKQQPPGDCYRTKDECEASYQQPTPAPTPSSTPQCWPSDNSECSYTVIDTGSFPDCWSTKEECLKHVQQYCFAPEGSWCVPKQQPPGGDCYKTKEECQNSYRYMRNNKLDLNVE